MPERKGVVGVGSLEEVVGKEVRRSIRPGAVITSEDVQSLALVRNNDPVTVTSRAGGVSVKREMRSRGNAAKGESVTLVSLDGRERVVARVTGYHEAEIVSPNTRGTNASLDKSGRIRFERSPATAKRAASPQYRVYRRR